MNCKTYYLIASNRFKFVFPLPSPLRKLAYCREEEKPHSKFKQSIDNYTAEEEAMGSDYEAEKVIYVENQEKSDELACPFCFEDLDVLGLCCHIHDDHLMEVQRGMCPLCAKMVGINVASHVITQHKDLLKALCFKKHRARSYSSVLLLRKDLQEKYRLCIKDLPYVGSSSDRAVDSMLLSFVNNPEDAHKPSTAEATSQAEVSLTVESSRIRTTLSTEAQRCKFLQGLVLSTILDGL